jgi:hypothetical protein
MRLRLAPRRAHQDSPIKPYPAATSRSISAILGPIHKKPVSRARPVERASWATTSPPTRPASRSLAWPVRCRPCSNSRTVSAPGTTC